MTHTLRSTYTSDSFFKELVGAGDVMAKTILHHFTFPLREDQSSIEKKRYELIAQHLIRQYCQSIDRRGAIVASAETMVERKLSVSCHAHATLSETMSAQQAELEVRLHAYGTLLHVATLKNIVDRGACRYFTAGDKDGPFMSSILEVNEHIMGYINTALQLLLESEERLPHKKAYRPLHKIALEANAELAAARL